MMEIKIARLEGDVIRVDALGKISRDGWPLNHEPFAQLFGPDIYKHTVFLNLANSNYLDSTGVEWLLSSHKKFNQAGGKLIVHSVKQVMQQILKMMRMDLVLNIAADEQAARLLVQGAPHEQPAQ